MRWAAVVLGALWGCKDDAGLTGSSTRAEDFAGRVGTVYAFAPYETPDDTPLLLAMEAASWETRTGEQWDDATLVAVYSVEVGESLLVEGVELLPPSPEAGSVYAGYYGTYEDAVLRTITEGTFMGQWVFARDLGPVHLTINSVELELVSYQDGLLDTGG